MYDRKTNTHCSVIDNFCCESDFQHIQNYKRAIPAIDCRRNSNYIKFSYSLCLYYKLLLFVHRNQLKSRNHCREPTEHSADGVYSPVYPWT